MTTAEKLVAAESALHRILLGENVVELRADGYLTRYDRGNLAALRGYIAQLKAELAGRPSRGGIGALF